MSTKGKTWKLSEETKLKMSLAKIGIPRSVETKEKIRQANTGKKRTEKVKLEMSIRRRGANHPNWTGGKYKDKDGYVYISTYGRGYNNRTFEHRLIMEEFLGRELLPTEVVHHINEIIDDNNIENLMLFENDIEHRAFHRELKKQLIKT